METVSPSLTCFVSSKTSMILLLPRISLEILQILIGNTINRSSSIGKVTTQYNKYAISWPAERAFMQTEFKCKIWATLTFAARLAERCRQRSQWQFTINPDGTYHPSLCDIKLNTACFKEQLMIIHAEVAHVLLPEKIGRRSLRPC